MAIAESPRSVRGKRPAVTWARLRSVKGFLFTLPFVIGFVGVFVIPFLYALVQSVLIERKSGSGFGGAVTEFAGLDNFVRGLGDEVFWAGVLRVTVFAAVQIPIMLVLSLVMALLLDAMTGRSARFFRLGLLIPHMIPGIVAALIWLYLYSPRLGPLTAFGESLGLSWNFFGSELLLLSIGNLLTWGAIGFNMLILYSSLRAVPRDLFEAARIDGASEARIAWSIKIPYVRGTLVLTGMLSIIGMLQIFNEPLVFRTSSPETITANFTPIMRIFNEAFVSGNYNYAAALSVILALLVGLVSAIFYKLTNRPQA
ncbi:MULTISPECIES: carbohydrate ABC transporter permease [unclassified Rathayibacter]|uniref:carbohydrate ABC transporter permease n=1 Tax=unclassified Rathayibacter TaxID=2609250 RepID=UPI000F4C0557|nr:MULTISPECIES: sugar ABC transporter permease [unclassified Rathayibacter]ROP49107.1 multiple sugar transport system permease protein [Rathayibacter sp. PhB186]ROS50776.1 multiple sugar transport system permease protein [Rathayibacter sp. PhB185]